MKEKEKEIRRHKARARCLGKGAEGRRDGEQDARAPSRPWTEGGLGVPAPEDGARAGAGPVGPCRVDSITHPLPPGPSGARLPTQSLRETREKGGPRSGGGPDAGPGTPQDPPPGTTSYSLFRPSLLGGRRSLWVQWGLRVPEQQDRTSALCWGSVGAETGWAKGLGREPQPGRSL